VIHERDGQTDGQTLRDSKDRACIASRGKNRSNASAVMQLMYIYYYAIWQHSTINQLMNNYEQHKWRNMPYHELHWGNMKGKIFNWLMCIFSAPRSLPGRLGTAPAPRLSPGSATDGYRGTERWTDPSVFAARPTAER